MAIRVKPTSLNSMRDKTTVKMDSCTTSERASPRSSETRHTCCRLVIGTTMCRSISFSSISRMTLIATGKVLGWRHTWHPPSSSKKGPKTMLSSPWHRTTT